MTEKSIEYAALACGIDDLRFFCPHLDTNDALEMALRLKINVVVDHRVNIVTASFIAPDSDAIIVNEQIYFERDVRRAVRTAIIEVAATLGKAKGEFVHPPHRFDQVVAKPKAKLGRRPKRVFEQDKEVVNG